MDRTSTDPSHTGRQRRGRIACDLPLSSVETTASAGSVPRFPPANGAAGLADVSALRRSGLTDAQWAALEPLLPKPKRSGRPPLFSKRQLIDGIRRRVRVGAPWRDVPTHYGSWLAVAGLFRRWRRAGVWAEILTALQARADAAGQT